MTKLWMWVVVVVLGGALFAGTVYLQSRTQPGVACTAEAKLCPDGSYVGRGGPNCDFAACPDATSTPSSASGIVGTVMLGPTCPVMRDPPDPQCADRPYATSFKVLRGGQQVATFSSLVDGTFSIPLAPGAYDIEAVSAGTLPRCAGALATVTAGAYAHVAISCDTGIR